MVLLAGAEARADRVQLAGGERPDALVTRLWCAAPRALAALGLPVTAKACAKAFAAYPVAAAGAWRRTPVFSRFLLPGEAGRAADSSLVAPTVADTAGMSAEPDHSGPLASPLADPEFVSAYEALVRLPRVDPAEVTAPTSRAAAGLDARRPGGLLDAGGPVARVPWAEAPATAGIATPVDPAASAQPAWGQCESGGALAVNLPRAAADVPGADWLGADNLAVSNRRCTRSDGLDDSAFAGTSPAGRSLNVGSAELVWASPHGETGLHAAMVRWDGRDSLFSASVENDYAYGPGGAVTAGNPDSRWLPVPESSVEEANSAYRLGLRQSQNWAGWNASADLAWTLSADGPEMNSSRHWAARAQLDRPLGDGVALSASWLRLAPGDLESNNLAIPGEQWVLGVNLDSGGVLPRALGIPVSAGLNWRYIRPDPALDIQLPASREINLGLTVPF